MLTFQFCPLQRVRRSPYASHPDFGEEQEMTCTMRNWQAQRTSLASNFDDVLPVRKSTSNSSKPSDTTLQMIEGDSHHQGPELLLRLVSTSTASSNGSDNGRFSESFNSFGSAGTLRAKRKVWAERRQESPIPQTPAYGLLHSHFGHCRGRCARRTRFISHDTVARLL